MGKYARELSDSITTFIRGQKLFFVATAPSDEGRINLSPKGYDTFFIVNTNQVAYIDYAGSGNETANHIRENGKMTFMWCSFDENPLILRIYGHGRVIEKGTELYGKWIQECCPEFNPEAGRQIIVCDIEAIQTSCGFGVPLMHYEGDRSKLDDWTNGKVEQGTLDDYIAKNSPRLETKFPLKSPLYEMPE
jgi:hypothetical protein